MSNAKLYVNKILRSKLIYGEQKNTHKKKRKVLSDDKQHVRKLKYTIYRKETL